MKSRRGSRLAARLALLAYGVRFTKEGLPLQISYTNPATPLWDSNLVDKMTV
jgi:hypothetical protein